MAHFALLWKARTIEKYRQNYENEKINSILMSRSNIPDKTLSQKWKRYKHGMKQRLSRTFSKWYPEGRNISNFFVNLRTEMPLPSILLRSFYGFIGGLCLTYLGFMFFVFQLSLCEMYAIVLSSVLGVVLTLGLTFSNRMRFLILLLVPQLFSRVGRYTLTCYALVLILTGPATNTLKNCEVLSTSMACTQEKIKLSVKEMNDSINKPYNCNKNTLKNTIKNMKLIVKKLKATLVSINKLILSIASIIESNFKWLISIADLCNDETSSPYDRCIKIMKENSYPLELHSHNYEKQKHITKSITDHIKGLLHALGVKNVIAKRKIERMDIAKKKYNDDNLISIHKISNEQPWLKNTTDLIETFCASMKIHIFFGPAYFTEATYVFTIKKMVHTFTSRIRRSLKVHLNVQHTYSFIGNSSSSGQITCGVITEIKRRADPILTWLSWSSCVTSLFLLLIIFRAKYYQHMFETRSRFDNRFITKEFRELDLKRFREGRETVLPLSKRERAKYVTTTSFRLVASEKIHINRSAVYMTITTFKLMIHIVADYSLYWVLSTIRYNGKMMSPEETGKATSDVVVTGEGFVARLLQALVNTLNSQLKLQSLDGTCLPNPCPPDFKRYCQIGFLIVLLWFFAMFEPYGLRLRHLIMGRYRPQRAKDRAAWLYNHILKTRASFIKFARRRLHRQYKYTTHSHLTFLGWIRKCLQYVWLYRLCGLESCDTLHCLLCNKIKDKNDSNDQIVRCEVASCPGSYCLSCFADIGQLCTICLSPTNYGDYSDASLENGSSNDSDIEGGDSFRVNKINAGYSTKKIEHQNDEVASFSRFRTQRHYSHTKRYKCDTRPTQQNHTYIKDNADSTKNSNDSSSHIADGYIKKNNNFIVVSSVVLPKYMSIVLVQCSVYEITTDPWMIVRYEYLTNIAKYLRKNKLIRRKKDLIRMGDIFVKTNTLKTNTDTNNNNMNDTKLSKESKSVKDHINSCKKSNAKAKFCTHFATKNDISTKKIKLNRKLSQKIRDTIIFTNILTTKKNTYTDFVKSYLQKRNKKRIKDIISTTDQKVYKNKVNKKCLQNFGKEKYVTRDNIIVNNIIIPRLNLSLSSESLEEQMPQDCQNSGPKSRNKHINEQASSKPSILNQKPRIKLKTLKRTLSNPLSIVKNVYSSLSLIRAENTVTKLKSKLENNKMSKNELKSKDSKIRSKDLVFVFTKAIRKDKPQGSCDTNDKVMQTELCGTKTDDKEVAVCPVMISCGCQSIYQQRHVKDFAVQVTTYSNFDRDSICKKHHHVSADPKQDEDEGNPEKRTLETVSSKSEHEKTTTDSLESIDNKYNLSRNKDDQRRCIKRNYKRKGNDNKNLFKLRYDKTSSNQSTLYERNHCDISTDSYDWWSPLLERKKNKDINSEDKKKKIKIQRITRDKMVKLQTQPVQISTTLLSS